MAVATDKHVFISYVREDSAKIDALCAYLNSAGIPYWRDRDSLAPGDAWKAKIREAIQSGSATFLACFSDQSRAKDKSYMNEELTLAIEEYRKMPPGQTWLIPVRLDSGSIPQWDLGAGQVLGDLNYTDLFGEDETLHAIALIAAINRSLGNDRPAAETTVASLAQVTEEDRGVQLQRLTKELILNRSRRIELDDLISGEIQRVRTVLTENRLLIYSTQMEQLIAAVQLGQRYWSSIKPFCYSLQVAARWGEGEDLSPWSDGLRTLVASAIRRDAGNIAALALRHLPAVAAISTAALSCSLVRKWANFKTLIVDQTVYQQYSTNNNLSLLEATDPYKIVGPNNVIADALARSVITGDSPEDSVSHSTSSRNGEYYTPVAEWLHKALRPIFQDQVPDDEAYDFEYDRAEVMLGIVSQHLASVRYTNPPDQWRARSRWFGRSTWRSSRGLSDPVTDIKDEISTQGQAWPPLTALLFNGRIDQARNAVGAFSEDFEGLRSRHF